MKLKNDGREIVEALGLGDKRVFSLDISLREGHVGEVIVRMWEDIGQNEGLIRVLKKYELVPREE